MGQPILLVVNDQERVLQALAGDLGVRFGSDHDIIAERSPTEALTTLEQLRARSAEVAIVIAAQQMEEMAGVGFLGRAHELHPSAKRVLLVGRRKWSTTHPAAQAMTLGQIDDYLFQPWMPLERWLYLPISQLLADWMPPHTPSFVGIRIVGPRWGNRAHKLRELLTRMGIPHAWYPTNSEQGRALLDEAGQDGHTLPVVVFHSGQVFLAPSQAELLNGLGFGTRPSAAVYDLAIVGAGPAGLAAAVYAASEGLRTLILESEVAGGQASSSAMIRNYLGFPRGINGGNLANLALEQAWQFGVDLVVAQQVTGVRARGPNHLVRLSDAAEVEARAVVIASGASWRRLDVPSLEALVGAGVFYGAVGGEAKAMQGREVVVLGAGNSAGQAAMHLARSAASVTILTRGASLVESMSDYLVRQIDEAANITVRPQTEVADGWGEGRLQGVTLRDRRTGATEDLPAAGLWVLIGAEPCTEWLAGTVQRDDRGYILTGHDLLRDGRPPPGWPRTRPPLLLETSIPGVFAAGDVRHRSVKRVTSAIGEGAVAVQLVHEYLGECEPE
jgi:thioredoxin reductase (NADPH)